MHLTCPTVHPTCSAVLWRSAGPNKDKSCLSSGVMALCYTQAVHGKDIDRLYAERSLSV